MPENDSRRHPQTGKLSRERCYATTGGRRRALGHRLAGFTVGLAGCLFLTGALPADAAAPTVWERGEDSIIRVAERVALPALAPAAEAAAEPLLLPIPKPNADQAGGDPAPAPPPEVVPPPRPVVAPGLAPGIKPLRAVTTDITVSHAPPDAAAAYFPQQPLPPPYLPRDSWLEDNAYGPGLNFAYRPLYFEEPNFERYGHSWGMLQPAASVAAFGGNCALLPWRFLAQPPCQPVYHAHNFRPGAPAPREFPMKRLPPRRFTD